MNRHLFWLALLTLSAMLGATGCATRPTLEDMSAHDIRSAIVGKPQIKLPGASLAEVKSIAMGAAHSKGWTLVDEQEDRILLQRPMDPKSPQAVALGATGASAPLVQVTSFFLDQGDGVLVALEARVLTEGPEETRQSIDYTSSYQHDLQRSLESLRANWSANRERVAAALAAERSTAQSPEIPYRHGDPSTDLSRLPDDPLKAAWAAETTIVDQSAPTPEGNDDATTQAEGPQPSDMAAAGPHGPPPLSAPTPAGRLAPSDRQSRPTGGGLLALDQTTQTGMWAYYAEQYATTRGCTLTDEGAVLVERRPEFEIHEVACWNLPTFRLRCQHGICRQLN